jgi:hypothetical protein
VFSSLADEIVLCIFSHLGLEGLCRVSSVCRRWRRLADDDTLWESLLYRACVSGGTHDPSSSPPVARASSLADLDNSPSVKETKSHRRSAIYYHTAVGKR